MSMSVCGAATRLRISTGESLHFCFGDEPAIKQFLTSQLADSAEPSDRFRMEVQSGRGFYNSKEIFQHWRIIPLKLELVCVYVKYRLRRSVCHLEPSNPHSNPRFVAEP